jgi:hypothetical protein
MIGDERNVGERENEWISHFSDFVESFWVMKTESKHCCDARSQFCSNWAPVLWSITSPFIWKCPFLDPVFDTTMELIDSSFKILTTHLILMWREFSILVSPSFW